MARSSRRNRKKLPEQPIELIVDRISHEGRGISSIDGKIAFVEGGLPGERVRAKYLDSRARFDELEVIDVLEPSEFRVSPPCEYFGLCGGCSLQHLAPREQINFKQDLLLDQLIHAAAIDRQDFTLLQIQQGNTEHYRRKARLAVRYVAKKDGALVGFRERHSTFITDMADCQVLTKGISALIKPLRDLVNSLDARQAIPQFEVASGNDEAGQPVVALVMRHLEPLTPADYGRLTGFAATFAVHFYLQPKGADSIHKIWPEAGEPKLRYSLPEHGLIMQFHPVDFVQINETVNQKAIALALTLLDLSPQDNVLDLFCGLGNFTLPMSLHCQTVVGIEGSDEMVRRAQENAALNKRQNVEFHAANLYELTGNESWYKRKFDKILLDPPRSGALEIIEWLGNSGASKIVYVSCNPATLARDAAVLQTHGYQLSKAGVMDMFPHTAHVESIAEFVLTGSGAEG